MSVYLQFDSLSRSQPYIQRNLGAGNVWVPNDNYDNAAVIYQANEDLIQSPTRYRVFYSELCGTNNIRTLSYLEHCRERPTNINYSVEACTLIVPANALVPRHDANGNVTSYVSILDEPYLYVRMMPINNAEGDLMCSNNDAANDATFMMWIDKIQPGTEQSPPITNPVPRPNPLFPVDELNNVRWASYKSCMVTIMRLDLQSQEWQIRIYDRFGNDVVLGEADNGGAGFAGNEPPQIDPNLQTSLIVGIRPNYT